MEHRLATGPLPLGTWQLYGYLIVYGASPRCRGLSHLGLGKSAAISLSTEHRLAAGPLILGTQPLYGYLLIYGTSPRDRTSPIWEPQIARPATHINEVSTTPRLLLLTGVVVVGRTMGLGIWVPD
ncbi:hypothetical protein Fot_38264 [Forsythia ovata]|uniref:Uncharacterized protein n=1 Tax=Forsythia ovata TaxID=205694 RepID=A0ABD1S1E4_9LAMI